MSVYELRLYQAAPGRMHDLLERFAGHTGLLFQQHNITAIGYWIDATDAERLIYVLRHDGSPELNWREFRKDPRWIAAREASEVNGVLTTSIKSTLMRATSFSELQ